jgi:beta-lactam-binding protein with PASTA domain
LPTVIVTTDQIITIKFNPGVEPIALVDVVGRTYEEAFQLLSTDGFVAQRVDQDDPEGRPAGTVIGQVPPRGRCSSQVRQCRSSSRRARAGGRTGPPEHV